MSMAGLRNRIAGRSMAEVVRMELRILASITGASLIAIVLWAVSIGTDYWFFVDTPPGGIYVNKTRKLFLGSRSGLWRICKTLSDNATHPKPYTLCENQALFPTELEIQQDPSVDSTILDYMRTETAFSIISVCLMFMGIGFSLYTFKERRYMFKRLAGGVHFLSAASVLVVIEVLLSSVKYAEQFLLVRHPVGSSWYYGVSFILAWLVFVVFLAAGCVFIICSRKRKGDRAASEELAREDEPHILGRV